MKTFYVSHRLRRPWFSAVVKMKNGQPLVLDARAAVRLCPSNHRRNSIAYSRSLHSVPAQPPVAFMGRDQLSRPTQHLGRVAPSEQSAQFTENLRRVSRSTTNTQGHSSMLIKGAAR